MRQYPPKPFLQQFRCKEHGELLANAKVIAGSLGLDFWIVSDVDGKRFFHLQERVWREVEPVSSLYSSKESAAQMLATLRNSAP